MNETTKLLKSINARLEAIQQLLAKTPLTEVLQKQSFSCRDVAHLSTTHGAQSYQHFTVRLACADGRIPDAYKRANGQWTIPRAAVVRILEEGIPPEQRNGKQRRVNLEG